MKSCNCYALRAIDCTCLPAKYDEIYEIYTTPEQEPVAHTTGHCENHKQKGGCQLHNLQCGWPDCDRKPITTQPEQEPVVWMYQDKTSHAVKFQRHMSDFVDHSRFYETPLYTTPLQRKPLTDEEIWNSDSIMEANSGYGASFETLREIVRAIEAAHGITGENT